MSRLDAVGHVRIEVAAAVATVLALALLAALPAAAGAANWSIQTTPNSAGAEHSALYDLACEPSGTSWCIAVGKQTTSGGVSTPYAAGWNGATWSGQSPTLPAETTGGEFQAASCLSKSACIAAGSYTTASGTFPLVGVWFEFFGWGSAKYPTPEGSTNTQLKGVSCVSLVENCMSVGYSVAGGAQTAVAIRKFPPNATLTLVPTPAEATGTELNGVDCTSASFCEAVGRYTVSGGAYWAMAAVWNGSEWSLQTVPKPAGAKRSILLDVSCSDSTHCTAVGGYMNSSGVQVTFVQRWNGTSWSLQTSPNPVGSTNTPLQSVSCANSSFCVGAGDWNNGKMWQPMAQAWNGTTWSLDTTPTPAGATFSLLEGVVCRPTCLAVGWYTDSGGKNKTLGEIRE